MTAANRGDVTPGGVATLQLAREPAAAGPAALPLATSSDVTLPAEWFRARPCAPAPIYQTLRPDLVGNGALQAVGQQVDGDLGRADHCAAVGCTWTLRYDARILVEASCAWRQAVGAAQHTCLAPFE